ncbi:amidohydrolase [Nitrosomonas sp. JL21]|uniref:amidohydrolase family protein n=1 Tax=Nitrosomonas sp. JL21 TaxID=153949 RepID=UPI0013686B6F|nr:amidohydrolase family protein [Nitrosomonas sp. JL21]MBL8498901.1 amidohydrolase family protein [Nitrosomonas sp.]MXS76685.1 amidohydrolase [Nitrosomonas sp. JL21]
MITQKNFLFHAKSLLTFSAFTLLCGFNHANSAPDNAASRSRNQNCYVLVADRVFDGFNLLEYSAVLIRSNKVIQTGDAIQLSKQCSRTVDLGDATILPGFIESHAHLTFQNIPAEIVLKHGITTARDTGGPLLKPSGGAGTLRLINAGPIIQASGGYPLNIFGHGDHATTDQYGDIGIVVSTAEEAQKVVKDLVDGGSALIKLSLELGGETGAPWMSSHGHGTPPATPWPLLSLDIVKAIVAKAHSLNRRVAVHVGENTGVELALDGGVDEWAHIPCAEIRDELLHRAVAQHVTFVTTIDTLSACTGIHANVHKLSHLIAHNPDTRSKFIYGSEIGHDNVPWGINGEEMSMMLHLTSGEAIEFADVLNVFKAATSEAGKNLGKPLLGTLSPGAPADIIAVRGNPFLRFKLLEYPDLVISGGHFIVNNFKKTKANP